jgi:hypothetical protein
MPFDARVTALLRQIIDAGDKLTLELVEAGSACSRVARRRAAAHNCLNKSRYSEVREYQGAQAESFYQGAPVRNDTQMETFDDWIHASWRCRNSVNADSCVASDPRANLGRDRHCSFQR